MTASIYHQRHSGELHERLQATSHLRVNVGSGDWPLAYWVNIDSNPSKPADVHASVPPLPYPDDCLLEIYAGHFLEHLAFEDGATFLRECYRCLQPGGRLGVVVPDTRLIMTRYLRGEVDHVGLLTDDGTIGYWPIADLDAVCAVFLFSVVQESRHLWAYDARTLRAAGERAGFEWVGEIDRYTDPRVSTGQWYQVGADFRKPGGQ